MTTEDEIGVIRLLERARDELEEWAQNRWPFEPSPLIAEIDSALENIACPQTGVIARCCSCDLHGS